MIFGDAPGVDTFCWAYCIKNNIAFDIKKAYWDRYRKSAGVIRNDEMVKILQQFKKTGGIAIWDGKSKGTKDAKDRLFKANKLIAIYRYDRTLYRYLK
jgi:predicted phage gp36 major capsid-like protein